MKKSLYKGMAMLALLAATASCEKDTLPTNFAPTVVTGSVTEIFRTGAMSVKGSIDNPNGFTVEEYGIQYSLYTDFAVAEVKKATSSPEDFSVSIDGLEPGTSYNYRAYVSSGHNIVYGKARSFQTVTTSAPQFDAETVVSNVGLTSFDVQATLLDDGGAEGGIQMRAFIYKPVDSKEVTELTMTTSDIQMKNVDEYTTTITNLYTGTLYAVRPVAVAGSGIGYGAIAYVTTTATDHTVLSECTLSDSTTNSIDVTAYVLATGTHPIVETGFCYSSENREPTVQNLTVSADLEETVFSATLSGLNAATTYYIRAYAKDDQGTVVYSETVTYVVEAHQDLDVETVSADEISTISARLWGKVRDNNVPVRERGICWSATEQQPTVNNATPVVVDTDDENYSITIDTEYNTTYYFRAYGKNSRGDVYYGEVLSFTTPDINLPELVMEDATEITDSTATLSAAFSLNYPHRADYTVKCGLLISTGNAEPTLESRDSQIVCDVILGEQLTTDPVAVPFSGKFQLQPDTKYYYRAYAENERGLVYSEVKSFTSKKRTPSPGDAPYPDVNN